jgi:hypothetical protein
MRRIIESMIGWCKGGCAEDQPEYENLQTIVKRYCYRCRVGGNEVCMSMPWFRLVGTVEEEVTPRETLFRQMTDQTVAETFPTRVSEIRTA